MKYLFVLLVLVLVGCAKPHGGSCDDVDGLKVADWNFAAVPDDYTGKAILCESGKVRVEIDFRNGKKDGFEKRWHPNGSLYYKIGYKDGELHGVNKTWYESGRVLEIYFKDGKKDGTYKSWFENGQLSYQINFKNDLVIDDKVIYYNKEGAIYKTEYYENGKIVRCEGDCD